MDYGYKDDEVKLAPFSFGLNAGAARMTKFEWTNQGGAGGTEGEALDITFDINGKEVGARKFPVTKIFDKNNQEITDFSTEDAKKAKEIAFGDFNSWMAAVMKCFVTEEQLKAALARPIKDFKEYVTILKALLPKSFSEIVLDIFMEYQYTIKGDNKMTYLQIPQKTKHGKFICVAVAPQGGEWKEVRMTSPTANDTRAIKYVDGENNTHPFTRTGWYANSNFANQQKEDDSETVTESSANNAASEAGSTWM